MSRAWRAIRFLGAVVMVTMVVAEIALAGLLFVASHTGHKFLIITGGSMEPTYALGSALLIKTLPEDAIQPGTVVTFKSVDGTLTTHRVIDRVTIRHQDYVQTQGDANPGPDPNFSSVGSVIGTPRFEIPAGGYTASFLLSPAGRLLVYAPPLVILLMVELRLVRVRLRADRETCQEETPESGTGSAWGEPVPLSENRGRHLPNVMVPALVIAVLASSVGAGLFVARSTAVFVDSGNAGGNTFTAGSLQPPTSVTATGSTGGASVSWTATASPAATGYTVYRANASGGSYASVGTVSGRTNTSFTDPTATGTVYYVVQSMAANWTSVNSNEASATVTATVWSDTGWTNCAANAADTGGDGNGFETAAGSACGNADGVYATDKQSGSDNILSCTDAGKDRHRFYNYGISLPANSTIGGIEVQTVGRHNKQGSAQECIQLSGDGGVTWTTAKTATYANVSTVETLAYGGSADLWGTTWTPASLVNGKLMVRIINVDDSAARSYDLDSVQVRVTYR